MVSLRAALLSLTCQSPRRAADVLGSLPGGESDCNDHAQATTRIREMIPYPTLYPQRRGREVQVAGLCYMHPTCNLHATCMLTAHSDVLGRTSRADAAGCGARVERWPRRSGIIVVVDRCRATRCSSARCDAGVRSLHAHSFPNQALDRFRWESALGVACSRRDFDPDGRVRAV